MNRIFWLCSKWPTFSLQRNISTLSNYHFFQTNFHKYLIWNKFLYEIYLYSYILQVQHHVWYALQHRTVFEKLEFKYCNTGKSCVQSSELDAKSDINEIKLMEADHAGGDGILSALYISLLPNEIVLILKTFLSQGEGRK